MNGAKVREHMDRCFKMRILYSDGFGKPIKMTFCLFWATLDPDNHYEARTGEGEDAMEAAP